MMAAQRQQLRHLDRAVLALLDERARLLRVCAGEPRSGVDDLLRRYAGPLSGQQVRELFAAIERATGGTLARKGDSPGDAS